jgi:hypothetical protein
VAVLQQVAHSEISCRQKLATVFRLCFTESAHLVLTYVRSTSRICPNIAAAEGGPGPELGGPALVELVASMGRLAIP